MKEWEDFLVTTANSKLNTICEKEIEPNDYEFEVIQELLNNEL